MKHSNLPVENSFRPLASAYDLVVIGGGSAGLTAASIGGRVCARTLLVDREALGGDCLFHGCVPSKSLIKCAKVAHSAAEASRFGVNVTGVEIDFTKVMDYVQGTIAHIGQHDSPEAMAALGVEVAFGGARFLARDRLSVGGREVTAKAIIIAVGSRAAAPPIPGLAETGFIDHVSLFKLRDRPDRLVVIGGGPVGVEMGQSFARLGSRVTLLQSGPHLLPHDDSGLSDLLREILGEEMTIHCDSTVVEVSKSGEAKRVVFEHGGHRREVECDEILVAVGRRPDLDSLGLEAAGIEVGSRGIAVDKTLRTTAKGVWACGDCVGSYQFTHYAEAQARTAARNALFRGSQKLGDPPVPWTTFSDPELAQVGLTEADAKDVDGAEVFRFPYERLDRAVCDGEARGLAKVICDKSGRVLGASILGSRAGEAITEFVIAMNAGITLSKLAGSIHVYPTMNRIVRRLGDERFMAHGVSNATAALFGKFKRECATPLNEEE